MFAAIAELAQCVVDAGAVPLLILCVQEPEVSLKRIAASALSDISKHSAEVRHVKCVMTCLVELQLFLSLPRPLWMQELLLI